MALGRDGIAGLILLAVSLALLVQSASLPQVPLVPVGPGFYPRLVLVFLGVTSAALVVQDVLARRRRAGGAAPPRFVLHRLVAATFAIVAAYCFLLPYLGYRLATPLFVAGLQAALEPPRGARDWGWLAAVALGTTVVTYLSFETYLLVLLPRGTLTGW